MNILYSFIFLGSGIALETVFYFLEKLIIYVYSRKGEIRNKKIYRIPFELLYWGKFPVVSTLLYYMLKYMPQQFNLFQIIFYFSIFAMGMYVLSEYFKELKY